MPNRMYAAQKWDRDWWHMDADPNVVPLLHDVQIKEAHKQGIKETKETRMKKKTWQAHRNKISILGWVADN